MLKAYSQKQVLLAMTVMFILVLYKFVTTMTIGWFISLGIFLTGYAIFIVSYRRNCKKANEIKSKINKYTQKKHG